jgi:anaerobic C4-dicarboxylate transporter
VIDFITLLSITIPSTLVGVLSSCVAGNVLARARPALNRVRGIKEDE